MTWNELIEALKTVIPPDQMNKLVSVMVNENIYTDIIFGGVPKLDIFLWAFRKE